jgi:hypothetical protein
MKKQFESTKKRGQIGRLAFGSLALLCLTVGVAAALKNSPAVDMRTAAVALLELTEESQRATLLKDFQDPERVGWHFIPKKERKGVPLRDMSEAQRTASLRMLRASLSEMGYSKASQIMLMEKVLKELEGPERTWPRDYQEYYVTLFGNPQSADDLWGLSFEGHHLSLNFVCRGSQVLDSTPQMFAANPAILQAELPGAPLKKGTRILALEETLAFDLVRSLSDLQKQTAIIAPEAPAEIRAAGEPQPPNETAVGISYNELTKEQVALLEKIVNVYSSAAPDEVHAKRMALIQENGWAKVRFAWAGALEGGIGHYYRIQGPTFLIEFVNTQPDAQGNPANHIHSVFRDMTGDFDLPINDATAG